MGKILVDTPMNGWSHMVGETVAELHEFAQKVGINRCWYSPNDGRPHYDLRGDKIGMAKAAGATQVTRNQLFKFLVEHYGPRKEDHKKRKKLKVNPRTNVNLLY